MTKCNTKSTARSSDYEPPTPVPEALSTDRSRTRSRNTYRGRRNDADDRPGIYSRAQIDRSAENEAFASNNNENRNNNLFVFGNGANAVQNYNASKFSFTAPRKPPKPPAFQFGPPFQPLPQPPSNPVGNNFPPFEKKSIYTTLNSPMSSGSNMQNSRMLTQSNIINGFNPFVLPQQNQYGHQQQPNRYNTPGNQQLINRNPPGLQFGVQPQQPVLNFNNNAGFQFNQPPQQQGPNLSSLHFGVNQQQTPHFNNQFGFNPGPNFSSSGNLNNPPIQFGLQFGNQPQKQQPQQLNSFQPPQFGNQSQFNPPNLQFGAQQPQQKTFQPPAPPLGSKNVLKTRATPSSGFNFGNMWKLPQIQQQPGFTPAPPHTATQPSPSGFNKSIAQLPQILPPAAPTPQPAPATPQFGFGAPPPAFGAFGGTPPAPVTSQPTFVPPPNLPKTNYQKPQAIKPQQKLPQTSFSTPGFNPVQILPNATSQNSLSLAQIQNLDLDTIINFRKSREADFRESMILFSKINPFAPIPMVEAKGKVTKTHNDGDASAMKEICLELPKSVVAATPLAKRIEFFKLSEREITFGKTIDDDRTTKKLADHFRRRKPARSIAAEPKLDSAVKPAKSRRKEHVSKPIPLRKPRREDRCTSCHILLPKSSVFVQCNACYVSQGTQCDPLKQNPCGIILRREGYYTIPSLEELPKLKRLDGQCIVEGFTIGRLGYGSVTYQDPINVTNLNLDEIVHFDHREISIYPDESNKPPIGHGLNKRAQVTLDSIYPTGKSPHDVIRDVETIEAMNFTDVLRKMCKRNGTRFVDYRPETGSWSFMVEHFSKHKFGEPMSKDEAKLFRKKERIELIERQIRLNEIRLGSKRVQRAGELIRDFKKNLSHHCEKFSSALKEVEDKISENIDR